MIRKLIVMLMILSSSYYYVTAQSPLDLGRKLEMPIDSLFRYGTLENGLKYYIYNTNNPNDNIEMTFAVKAGNMHEEKPEIAHLVEHLLFRTLRKYPEGASNYLERYGIKSNANTGKMTIYSIKLPFSTVKCQEIGLDLLRDWSDGALMIDRDVESQKGAILEEGRSVGSLFNLDDEIISRTLDHPKYPKNIRELMRSSLLSLSSTDVKAFYQKYYRPDKMGVIVVGNLKIDSVEGFIHKKFNDLKNNIESGTDSILIDSWAAKLTGKNSFLILQDAGVEGLEFRILKKRRDANKFDALTSVSDYKKLFLEKLSNDLISKRLVQLSKEPHSSITVAFSNIDRMGIHHAAQLDVLGIVVRVKNDLLKTAIQTTILEFDNIINEGFLSFELEEAKRTLLRESAVSAHPSIQNWSSSFVDHFNNGSAIISPKDKVLLAQKLIEEISLDDVNKMSSEWLKQDVDQDIVIVVPNRKDELVPSENNIKSWIDSRPKYSVRMRRTKAVIKEIMSAAEIKSLNEGKNANNWNVEEKTGVSSITLPNGIKVHLKSCPSDTFGSINLVGISPFGYARYPVEKQRLATFVGDIVSHNGVAGLNSLELNEQLASKEVGFVLSIDSCESSIVASTRNSNELEVLFQLVYKRLKDSLLNHAELNRWKSQIKSRFEINLNTGSEVSFDEMYSNSLKFQVQPLSIKLTKSDIRKMSFKGITELYTAHFVRPNDFEFVITGNFDLEKVKLMVSKYLGSIPGNSKEKEVCSERADIVKYVDKMFYEGDTDFADVNTVYSGIEIINERDYIKLNLLSKILKNILFDRLRSVEGGIYDVITGTYSRGENASLYISFRCDPERIESLRSAMNEEITNLIRIGLSDSLLLRGKESTRNDITQKLELGDYWQNHLVDKIKGRSLYALDNWDHHLSEITENEIRQAASMFMDEKNRTELTRIPESFTKSQ